jgi:thiol-disulfide isomerase/thioredoxin
VKLALATLILLLSLCPSGLAAFRDALEGKLVKLDADSGELRPHKLPDAPEAEYFMIYFSAHWCPPCRKRTPILVSFYNEAKAKHPGFEFILVSNDRSKEAMAEYMRWAEMPWPALAWEQRASIPAITELSPPAIPFMAMFDKDGRLLGASDLGGFNVGIPTLISGLQKKLGLETYNLDERHRKTSPLILIAYALGGGFLVVLLIRRRFRRENPEA